MQHRANNSSVSLPEKDYLAILDLIQKFHDCRDRTELKLCMQNHLLPLINADRANYVWMDVDFSNSITNVRCIDLVGYQPKYGFSIEKTPKYMTDLNQKITKTNLQVISTDIDVPLKNFQMGIEIFFKENPEFKKEDYPDLAKSSGAIALVDRPDLITAIGIQRISPNTEAFTLRDVRMMELLQPHIIQCIKTIFLNEELKQYKALSETLAEVPTAMALISLDHRVLFRNAAFSQLLPIQAGQRLPRDIIDPMKKKASRYNPPFESDLSAMDFSFVKLPQGVFRLVVSLLNRQGEEEGQCWLLRLKPAVESFSKMNLLMQEEGLTGREMEIASLVRDGMDDKEIGGRLFISIHTVRNHIKNIHQKLDTHTRAKLVAVLNPGEEEHSG